MSCLATDTQLIYLQEKYINEGNSTDTRFLFIHGDNGTFDTFFFI